MKEAEQHHHPQVDKYKLREEIMVAHSEEDKALYWVGGKVLHPVLHPTERKVLHPTEGKVLHPAEGKVANRVVDLALRQKENERERERERKRECHDNTDI